MKFECAWCGDALKTRRIIGRRNNNLWFVDGYHTKVIYETVEVKEFCSENCRAEYYFGM
jgi:hypothetical protein